MAKLTASESRQSVMRAANLDHESDDVRRCISNVDQINNYPKTKSNLQSLKQLSRASLGMDNSLTDVP
jgi:hypothetical protein